MNWFSFYLKKSQHCLLMDLLLFVGRLVLLQDLAFFSSFHLGDANVWQLSWTIWFLWLWMVVGVCLFCFWFVCLIFLFGFFCCCFCFVCLIAFFCFFVSGAGLFVLKPCKFFNVCLSINCHASMTSTTTTTTTTTQQQQQQQQHSDFPMSRAHFTKTTKAKRFLTKTKFSKFVFSNWHQVIQDCELQQVSVWLIWFGLESTFEKRNSILLYSIMTTNLLISLNAANSQHPNQTTKDKKKKEKKKQSLFCLFVCFFSSSGNKTNRK